MTNKEMLKNAVAIATGVSAYDLIRGFYKAGENHSLLTNIGNLISAVEFGILTYGISALTLDRIDEYSSKFFKNKKKDTEDQVEETEASDDGSEC